MKANSTLKLNAMFKKTLISCVMIGAVVLAAASSGGGKKKSESPLLPNYTPIRTSNGFTLKAGPSYAGSHLFSTVRDQQHTITYNTVVTYQKGNTIFILPQQVKMNTKPVYKSNLNLLDLKLRLHK